MLLPTIERPVGVAGALPAVSTIENVIEHTAGWALEK